MSECMKLVNTATAKQSRGKMQLYTVFPANPCIQKHNILFVLDNSAGSFVRGKKDGCWLPEWIVAVVTLSFSNWLSMRNGLEVQAT